MYHEKIFVRDNGVKVRIGCTLSIDHRECYWLVDVETCQPRKRTWINAHDRNDYQWRKLNIGAERDAYMLEKQLAVCTLDEIKSVKREIVLQLAKEVG